MRRRKSILLLLLLAMLLYGCGKTESPVEDSTQVDSTDEVETTNVEPVPLTIGYGNHLGCALYFIAEEEGYFDKHGLDEPFNGLDERMKNISQDFLIKHKEDRSIIFVTHNEKEIINFADRVYKWDKDNLQFTESEISIKTTLLTLNF